jgi:dTDP-L-rhamnose 4-epimerase
VDLLLERGHRVRILDNLQAPVHQGKEWPDYVPAQAERLLGSVEDAATWKRALEDVDAVVHLAAYQD